MKPCLAVAALIALVAAPLSVHAQDDRLATRLDARTLAGLQPVMDSARGARLPTEPLVQKALEGAAKGAEGGRIVAAVRALAQRLGRARAALGQTSTEAELVSGAAALQAGVAADRLAELRSARPGGSLVLPLVVIADLVARGVPADTAAGTIIAIAGGGADDAVFAALRRDVERDIASGLPPAAAVAVRARGVLVSVPVRRPASAGTTLDSRGIQSGPTRAGGKP